MLSGYIPTDRETALLPKAAFPTQLIQACEALRFVLHAGYEPSRVGATISWNMHVQKLMQRRSS